MLKRTRRWLFRSLAMLRVTAYAAFAFFVLAFVASRVLLADVKEAALSAGHQLGQLGDLVGGAETIHLNGERMHHASVYTDQDVGTVLDRFETYCASSPSALGRAMTDFPKELADKVEKKVPSRAARLGIVRDEAKDRGMVACFVNDRPSGIDGFVERMNRFLSNLKLSEFGKFRYAFAEKTKGGDTHVVTIWADTGLDISAMFPAEGDAAGADSLVLPRPPHARRTLSAAAEEMPYGLRVYASTDRADSVKRYYGAWMGEHGFHPVEGGEHDGTTAYLRDDGYQAFVSIGEDEGRASVTLVEAGRTDVPPTAAVQATVE
jgi:hypothetical protein